ncbi:hypothetical protein E2986_07058 [Frieseomelitta varia]|uniref:Odorant receptor 13a n=1 Tax=Frieseomelitta varia TaxID=561572 RepID=A0A833S5N2_9HYME|nr:hypothetical protein E2986_07058 [Frieseomelitta varia]
MCRARASPLKLTAGKFCWFTVLLYSQVNLNYQLGWNRYIMKYVGIWPKERKWNRLSSYVVLLPSLTMLCFVCAPQTANLPFIAHDLNLVVENLSMAMTSLLKCVAKDWATVETRTGRETMMNVARISRKTTIGCLMLCQLVAASYMFLRLSTLKHSDNKLVYRSYFPYNASISPSYELTMIGQVMAGAYGALTYTSVDTFIAMLVLHACGQLSNLKDDLRNIHSCDRKDLQASLKKIVEKHNYIIEFAETVENCFNVMLLIQMLGFTVQLCFQSFQAITSFGDKSERFMIFQIIFLVIYIACVMVQLYLYCYVGERLMLESMDVANTAYNCEWYSLPPKDARLLIIIMCRARTSPLKITAGKFCWFSVQLYSQVLKTTMSYISVLHATKNLNYQLGWNRYLMKYVGIWPKERKWNQLSSYVVLLPSLTMLCFVCAPQTANLPFIAHDLNLVVENLSMAMTSLLKCMAKDWATVETSTGRETMINAAKMSRKTTIGCLMLCQLVSTSYVFLRLSTLKHSDNKLVYRSYFPYNVSISPSYELTMIGQGMAGIYAALTYTSVDTFIVMLVLHACGQLSNMKDDLRNIHSCDRKDLQASLKKIVEKHIYITVYVRRNSRKLFQRNASDSNARFHHSSMLPVFSYDHGTEKELYFFLNLYRTKHYKMTYLFIWGQIRAIHDIPICLMVQLYLYCYVGEKLMLESMDVANTAYSCEWYSLPPKDARLLIIIMCRARASPLKLTAGKFCWFTVLLYSQVSKNELHDIRIQFSSLLMCMAKDWAAVEMKTKRETMVNIARITRKTTIRCSMMCQLVFVCYVSLRLLSMKYDDNKLFVRGYYPYDVTISPNYELTMIGQVIAGIYGAVTFPAVDTFIATLVLHACGQLSNLKNDLRMIHSYDKKDVQTKLKKIVQEHNYINRFAETIENSFNLLLLFQMLGCTVQLCFQSFQAIMSTDVAETAYHCEWYNLSPEIARLLIIIMCRARASPLKITAGKFCWFTVSLYSQYGWNRSIMKYIGIWPEERKWNRPSSYVVLIPFLTMLSLLKCIAKDWATVETKTGRETMINIARMSRKIIIGCSMMCQLVVALYVILRLIFMKYDDNKMFVRGYYPYDTTVSPNYELTLIGQAIAGTYSCVIYSSVDSFIAMLILHACGQISNLKNDLKEIHSYDKIDLRTKLMKIVEKHNYINRFAETIENCFNIMLLIQMLGCTVQLCFQSFQAIMSTEIAETAYECEWYNLPPEIARLLIIIMCRARASPLRLTAGKFCWYTILLYSQVNLNYQYGWNHSIMKYAGIWPEERKWNRPSSYVVLIPFLTMLCFACAPQTINLPFIIHDLNLVVENLSNNEKFSQDLLYPLFSLSASIEVSAEVHSQGLGYSEDENRTRNNGEHREGHENDHDRMFNDVPTSGRLLRDFTINFYGIRR